MIEARGAQPAILLVIGTLPFTRRDAGEDPSMTRAATYPKYVLREANAWLRGHPWQADGLLAAALLAFSAPQFAAGQADGLIPGGLAGLVDRVQTVDGRLSLDSPAGGPTTMTVELPVHA